MPPVKSVLNKFIAFTFVFLFLAIITVCLHFMITNWWICASLALIYAPFILITFVLYRYTRMRGPISYIGRRIFLTIYNFTIYRRRFLWEQLYDVLCWLIPSTEWKYMNWGYASLSSDGVLIHNLAHEDENERFSVQLYHYVATAMESWEDLEGKTILEVSSGRGGGLDYISRYLKAERCIGVDISPVQIEYCKKIYKENTKLAFLKGESEKLSKIEELTKEEIDIVINVESGHCYSNFKKFIREVEKVLKPGGIFAYSDFRPTHEWPDIEKELESSDLKIIKKENISENVIHSLKLDEDRKWKLIQSRLGPVLRFFFKQIGGVKGSHIYEGLNQKTMASMAYVLKKPEELSLI